MIRLRPPLDTDDNAAAVLAIPPVLPVMITRTRQTSNVATSYLDL
jgi:hypothetical protein